MTTDEQGLTAAITANPADDTPKLVYADWLDDHGGDGRLWRELVAAYRKVSAVPPSRQPKPPADWAAAVDALPPEWRSWFAAGCALRCALWVSVEFTEEQTQDVRDVLGDLITPAWSPEMWSRADAAWSRADAARSRAHAAWSRANAARSRADAAWSRADAARSRTDATGSRAYAAWSRANAAWSRAYAAESRAYAAESRAYAAESRWQAAWLNAVAAVVGVVV